MLNAVTKVLIEDQEFSLIANVGKMIQIEKATGETFMNVLKNAESGGVSAIATLLGACLCKDKKSVGIDYIAEMDFDVFEELVTPLMEVIAKAFPQADRKKKVIVMGKMK